MRAALTLPALAFGAGALALVGVLVWVKTKGTQEAAASVAKAAADAAAGAVLGIGDAVGLPRTDADKCAEAKASGSLWEASFVCPAGDYLGHVWDSVTGNNLPAGPRTAPEPAPYEDTAPYFAP
jgi:hypothetical protein